MSALEIGKKLVGFCNDGTPERAVQELYANTIVSVEAPMEDPEADANRVVEGMAALLEKHAWWDENFEVHESVAHGPYIGGRDNEFVVRFNLDATNPAGVREQMEEVGVYTVDGGKVVREEFMYLA